MQFDSGTTFSYGGRKCGTTRHIIHGHHIWILELGEVLTAKKEDGTIHDRIACGVYLRAVFISLAVDVWEGI